MAVTIKSSQEIELMRQAGKILHLNQKVLFYGTVEQYRNSSVGRRFLGGEDT